MLKLNTLSINNINGIEKLDLKFNPGFNIICGENGIGKTTILNCIATSFNKDIRRLTKNVNHKRGEWEIVYELNSNPTFKTFNVDQIYNNFNQHISTNKVINFFVDRTSSRGMKQQLSHIQKWFFNNYYNSLQLSNVKYHNLLDAKDVFSLLNPNIKYSRCVERYKFEENFDLHNEYLYKGNQYYDNFLILLETPAGEIPLEYLSSGYLSCLLILLRIIKKIEDKSNDLGVKSFDGLIIIDEIDLHLHPEWQAKLINILRNLVPNAQLIVTTHSPHIIQVAKTNEVIALTGKSNKPNVNKQILNNKYGFQGWTIEEILEDVMGLNNTHSDIYKEFINKLDKALNELDGDNALYYYKKINDMLHPQNHLRKILRIQLGVLGDINYD